MIDLLPPHQKKRVNDEIRWRLLVSLFLIIALTGLAFSAILYVLNLISADLISTEMERIDQAKEEIPITILREDQILNFNNTMSELLFFYTESADMTETFQLLYEVLPSGSRIDSIRYERSLNEKEEVIHKMTVTGYAPEWQSMLEIERGLKEQFDNVLFSPGAWTRLTDIDFSISFTLR